MQPIEKLLLSEIKKENPDTHLCITYIAMGANPNLKCITSTGWQISHFIAQNGSSELFNFCLDKGCKITKTNSSQTLLHAACASRLPNIEIVKKIISLNLDINATDENGQTPLHFAAYSCNEATNLLIQHGAKLDIKDDEGLTPIDIAEFYQKENLRDYQSRGSATNPERGSCS